MAITFIGSYSIVASNPNGDGYDLFSMSGISTPQVGDLGVGIIYCRAGTKTVTAITGCTAVKSDHDPTDDNPPAYWSTTNGGMLAVFYKVLDSTDIANGSFGSFTLSSVSNGTGGIITQVYRGVDATTPIRAYGTPATGSGTSPDPPNVSITSGDTVLAIYGEQDDDAGTHTAPSNYTLPTNGYFSSTSGTDGAAGCAYRIGVAASSEDPATFTLGNGGGTQYWYAISVALKPDISRSDSTATGSADLKGGRTGTADGSAYLATPAPMHLEVPLEMLDIGLGSLTTGTFEAIRSRITLDTGDYDGTPTYYFEVVYYNNTGSSQNIILRNRSDSTDAVTLSCPASATPTRLRSSSFSPATGSKTYSIIMPQTSGGANLMRAYAARIIVVQTHPTKTRIQIPLAGTFYGNYYNDDTTGTLFTTTSTAWTTNSSYASKFLKTDANWATVSTSGWTLETLSNTTASSGTSAYSALARAGTITVVSGSTIQADNTAGGTWGSASFSNDATNFTDAYEFELRIKENVGGGATATVFAARLYVKLESVTKAEVYHRVLTEYNTGNTASSLGHHRHQFNSSNYAGTTVGYYAEGNGYCDQNINAVTLSAVSGTSSTSGSDLTGAAINYTSGTSNKRVRTGTVTAPTDGYDVYFSRLATTSNSHTVALFWLTILTGQASGGGSYTDSTATGSADLQKALTDANASGSADLKKAFTDANATGSAALVKSYTDSTATGSADLKASLTGTAAGAADLKKSLTGSAEGAAYLGKAYTGSSEGAADLKKAFSAGVEGAADLKKAFSGSAEGAADLKKAFSGSSDGSADLTKALSGSSAGSAYLALARTGSSEGSADLKKAFSASSDGAAALLKAFSGTAAGSADLTKSITGSSDGAADLKKSFTDANATGAAYLQGGVTPRTDSDTTGAAALLKALTGTAAGAADLKQSLTGTAAGAADLTKSLTGSSDGSADLKQSRTGTAEGSADLKQSRSGTAAGAAALLKPSSGTAQGSAYLVLARSGSSEGAAALLQPRSGTATGSAYLAQMRSGSSEGSADLKQARTGTADGAADLLKSSSGSATGAADLQQARSGSSEGAAALLEAYSGSSTGAAYLRPAVPVVTSIVPNVGPKEGGTEVVISGYGFVGATSVKFGTTEATSFTVDSDMQITAVAPPGTGF